MRSLVLLFTVFTKCLYLDNNCSILFFILFSAKLLLLLFINSVSFFKFSPTSSCQSKSKKKLGELFWQSYFFRYYNDLIKLLWTFLLILLCWYKRYSISFISSLHLYELFPVFICGNNIGIPVNSLFEVKIFIFFSLLLLCHRLSAGQLMVNQ